MSNYIMVMVATMAFMKYKKFLKNSITTNILSNKFIFMANGKNRHYSISWPNTGILLQHSLWIADLNKMLKLEKRLKSWDY